MVHGTTRGKAMSTPAVCAEAPAVASGRAKASPDRARAKSFARRMVRFLRDDRLPYIRGGDGNGGIDPRALFHSAVHGGGDESGRRNARRNIRPNRVRDAPERAATRRPTGEARRAAPPS